jgi:hypothetical protein
MSLMGSNPISGTEVKNESKVTTGSLSPAVTRQACTGVSSILTTLT